MEHATPKNLPGAINYAGCACLVAWFLLLFSGEIWGADFERAAGTVVLLSLLSIAGCFIALLILDRIALRRRLFAEPLGLWYLLLGLLLSAGTVGIVFASYLPTALFIVFCLIAGFSGALFICATVIQLSHLSPRNILIYCGGIFLAGILVYSFAFYVPQLLTLVILCALPTLASIFFAFSKEGVLIQNTPLLNRNVSAASSSSASPTNAESAQILSWRSVVLLSIFMLFSCVVRGYLPLNIDNASFSYVRSISIILMLFMAAIVIVVPALLPARYRLSSLYKVILILGVVLFALFPIFGMDNSIALVLADGYRGLCALLAIAFFACMARLLPFFGLKHVCGGLAVYVSFGIIGWLIGSALYYLDPGESTLRIYSSLQCVLVLLAFILLYRQSEFDRFIDEEVLLDVEDTQSELNDNGLKEEASGRWSQQIKTLAQTRGLTAREEDVFFLLAKGYKAQNISERLHVSYNTARAHIRNIYQKCDVHSQHEFIDLIESSTSLAPKNSSDR